jgi:DNA-binding CsgD family transcriptional regulator
MRTSPGPVIWTFNAHHRLELLDGQPSAIHPHVADPQLAGTLPQPSAGTLWLVSREAIDAGASNAALEFATTRADPVSRHHDGLLAAIEAAATGSEDRWHDALRIALEQGLRLVAVDAFEGLAACAAEHESWAECLRLIGAAERLRDETGYQWRFGFEQLSIDDAQTTACEALAGGAEAALDEGRNLDWREAAAYARRARGERRRPHHGWASLTPTEQQVVALISEGLTNPEIAQRLLMGKATVKTHLTRIFGKLGVRTRAELAADAVRRTQA